MNLNLLVALKYLNENVTLYETIKPGSTSLDALLALDLNPSLDSLCINGTCLSNGDPIPSDANEATILVRSQLTLNTESKIRLLRRDYSQYPVYTIDPSGSTDADDGFSIFKDHSGATHLLIHIADPTAFLTANGNLFKKIVEKGQTRYPFGEPPVHLFPEQILKKSTLINGSDIKTVAVHAVFDYAHEDQWKLVSAGIEFCTVKCDNQFRFTYEEAADLNNETLKLGVSLATHLWRDRVKNTPWIDTTVIFNDMILTIPRPGSNSAGPILEPDTDKVKIMKSMIAEFAILSNTVFAKGLTEGSLFLRSASITEEIRESSGLTGEDLLKKIITEKVAASYTSKKETHDIVTGSFYTHSTSPLRRASDCIVHFLLKAKALNLPAPFTEEELKTYAMHLTCKAKEFKKEQFASIKRQTLLWIKNNIPVKAECTIMSVVNGFINISINRLNDMPVNICYTIRQPSPPPDQVPGKRFSVVIKEIYLNPNSKYDAGTLPDLEKEIYQSK